VRKHGIGKGKLLLVHQIIGDFMEMSRPLDALNKARDKRVIVELKNNKQYIGNLDAFDIHINVVLNDAEERFEGEVKRKLGTVFIRGDTITIISTQ
jgi:small nuclear ribonucleoprotein